MEKLIKVCYNDQIPKQEKPMKTLTKVEKTTKFATKHFRIGMITPSDGSDIFYQSLQAMCELGFVVSVLALGNERSQEKLMDISDKYKGQFEILEATPQNEKKIISQSDVILFLSKPEKKLMEKIMKKGIVPITPFCEELENFNAQEEKGNAFCFNEGNFWELFATIVRAFENYKFAYDWNNLQKSVKKSMENS